DLEALVEVHGRLVPEQIAGAIDTGQQPLLGVPDPGRRPLDASAVADQLDDLLGQLEDLGLPARRQVHLLADRLLEVAGPEEAVDDVTDVGEVASLLTGAGEGERQAGHGPEDE